MPESERLVDEAVASFKAKDYQSLDENILKLGQELGVELETEMDETLKVNQKAYDFLFGEGKFNLKQEYLNGNILKLNKEQGKEAEKQGYSQTLIMPGQMPREELLKAIQQKYAQEFSSEGVYYWDQAQTDLNQTEAVKNPNRPNKFYTIALKPQQEVSDAHPETMNKNLEQAQEILTEKQQENPQLNLMGLTLPEYLLVDCLNYSQTNQHLEEKTWSWLLEEKVTEQGQGARCLDVRWRSGRRRVSVDSHSVSVSDSNGGARFGAVAFS